MTEINDIESFLKEKEEQLKGIKFPYWKVWAQIFDDEQEPHFEIIERNPNENSSVIGKVYSLKDAEFISQSPELVSTLIKMVRCVKQERDDLYEAVLWAMDERLLNHPNVEAAAMENLELIVAHLKAKRIMEGK